jgi:hypothetical protein
MPDCTAVAMGLEVAGTEARAAADPGVNRRCAGRRGVVDTDGAAAVAGATWAVGAARLDRSRKPICDRPKSVSLT